MTEYDYSPEAYERYQATLRRVDNWVSDQAHRSQQYSSPFGGRSISSPPHQYDEPSPFEHRHGSRDRSRSSSRSSSSTLVPALKPIRTHDVYEPSRTSRHSSHSSPLAYSPPSGYPPGVYRTYDSTSRDIVLPPPRPGETYVIVPPKGRSLEIVVRAKRSSICLCDSNMFPVRRQTAAPACIQAEAAVIQARQ